MPSAHIGRVYPAPLKERDDRQPSPRLLRADAWPPSGSFVPRVDLALPALPLKVRDRIEMLIAAEHWCCGSGTRGRARPHSAWPYRASGPRQRVDDLDSGDYLASIQILTIDVRGFCLLCGGHDQGVPKHDLCHFSDIDRPRDGIGRRRLVHPRTIATHHFPRR
jgi:hypothetical protein